MKIRNLILGMLACTAMVACSSEDDPIAENPINQEMASTDQAYLSIQLVNATGTMSRGISNGFEDGTDGTNSTINENGVKTVDFYFYNSDGTFNQHVSNNSITFDKDTEDENIEKLGNATVVLQDLKTKGQPKYVVVVLNDNNIQVKNSAGIYYNLSELKVQTVDNYKNSIESVDYFIMTNSTYNGGAEQVSTIGYFATCIEDESFLKEDPSKNPQEADDDKAVKIYVERLAVKVKVSVNPNSTSLSNTDQITIGTNFNIDDKDNQTLQIKILGWDLSATTKTSYWMKNVPEWTYFDSDNTTLGTAWKTAWMDNTNHRSYWAESTNYGTGVYPTSFGFPTEDTDDKSLTDIKNASESPTLNYESTWTSIKNSLGADDYCMENTNTATVLKDNNNFKATATHVLLKAQLVDYIGTDLVRFYGRLYTKDVFYKLVLSELTTKYYKKVDATTYKQIEITDIDTKDEHDGRVSMVLRESDTNAGYTAPEKWYTSSEGTAEVTKDEINNALKAIFDDGKTPNGREYAEYYKDGMMYYCIPIEHLRNGKISYKTDGTYDIFEGDYGVVRNHYYNLSISKIENLGTAVYAPEEVIVPNPDIVKYYVGAEINILSWKVVNQGVEL